MERKNSEDNRDLVLGRMTWINESDFNIFLEYQLKGFKSPLWVDLEGEKAIAQIKK